MCHSQGRAKQFGYSNTTLPICRHSHLVQSSKCVPPNPPKTRLTSATMSRSVNFTSTAPASAQPYNITPPPHTHTFSDFTDTTTFDPNVGVPQPPEQQC
jgi:hypothetical protein